MLPCFRPAATNHVRSPRSEVPRMLLVAGTIRLSHPDKVPTPSRHAVVVPGTHRNDEVLSELLLSVQVACVAMVELVFVRLVSLAAMFNAIPADDTPESTSSIRVCLLCGIRWADGTEAALHLNMSPTAFPSRRVAYAVSAW